MAARCYRTCAFCDEFAQKSALVTLLCEGNLESLVPQGAKHQMDAGSNEMCKTDFRSDFLKKVNALLNAGPGQILIHGNKQELCFFDEQVDSSLMSMLCEDSIFSENFERFTLNDTHITFRVKPSKRKAISTFDFHSKLYLHKGLVDPTQAQMKYLMATERDKPPAFDKPRKPDLTNLEVGQDLIFPWSLDMQAKMIQPSVLNVTNKKQIKQIAVSERFVNYWWNQLKLPNYIAAFSKQPYGGSFFIGLKVNEKEYGTKWKQVKNMDGIGEIFGTSKRVWIDDKNNQVLHFYTEEDVPKLKVNTRTYKCQGVQLSQEDCEQIKKNLEVKLKDHVKALPNGILPHVKWAFYQLNSKTCCKKNEKPLFIIEAEIQPFYGRGVFFQVICGPEAYTTDKKTRRPTKMRLMNYQEWLDGIKN